MSDTSNTSNITPNTTVTSEPDNFFNQQSVIAPEGEKARQYIEMVAGQFKKFSIHRKLVFPNDNISIPGSVMPNPAKAAQIALFWGKQGRDIYLAMGEQDAVGKTEGRTFPQAIRKRYNIIQCSGVYLDLDVKEGAYNSQDEARNALEAFIIQYDLPLPSAIVSSGTGGLHVYWVSEELFLPEEHAIFSTALISMGETFGLHFDRECTKDVCRLLRIPETWNYKTNPASPVKLLRLGDKVSLDTLRTKLNSTGIVPSKGVNPTKTNLSEADANDDLMRPKREFPPVDFNTVTPYCEFLHNAELTGGMDEKYYTETLWKQILSLTSYCIDGRSLAHKLSDKHGAYTSQETDLKFDQCETDKKNNPKLAPTKCATLMQLGVKECITCQYFNLGTTPLNVPNYVGSNPATPPVAANPVKPTPRVTPVSANEIITNVIGIEDTALGRQRKEREEREQRRRGLTVISNDGDSSEQENAEGNEIPKGESSESVATDTDTNKGERVPPQARPHVKPLKGKIYAVRTAAQENAVLELFSQHYRFVKEEGKIVPYRYDEEKGWLASDRDSMKLELANIKIDTGKKNFIPAYSWYVYHHNRPPLSKLVFRIDGLELPGETNLWHGYDVGRDPATDQLTHILKFFEEVLCAYNKAKYEYLLDWVTYVIKYPDRIPEVAVVLRSDAKGVGKNTFTNLLVKILGRRHAIVFKNKRHIFGQHATYESLHLAVLDEITIDRDMADFLDATITGDTRSIDPKFRDGRAIDNRLAFILLSNHDFVIPAGHDERRYFVIDVSEHRAEDFEYFNWLLDVIKNGGAEQLLDFLLKRDMGNRHPRKVLKTKELEGQRKAALHVTHQYLYSLVDSEDIKYDVFSSHSLPKEPSNPNIKVKPIFVPYDDLIKAVIIWTKDFNFGRNTAPLSEMEISKDLAKVFGESKKGSLKLDPRRKRGYYFWDAKTLLDTLNEKLKLNIEEAKDDDSVVPERVKADENEEETSPEDIEEYELDEEENEENEEDNLDETADEIGDDDLPPE